MIDWYPPERWQMSPSDFSERDLELLEDIIDPEGDDEDDDEEGDDDAD